LIWGLPDVASKPAIKYPKLIIPYKRDMNRRISEQEARFVYCSVLNNSEFFYSIETPTEREYRLSGKGKRSASTDLSIYKYTNGFKKLVNVEFKAHNARFNEIEKDIKKLVHEGITGNWFHLLVNVNSRTLKALFGKIKRALIENYSEKISILFCFCVLSKRWACIKHFSWDSEKRTENYDIFIERFFEFDYEVKRKIKVIDGNEWLIYAGT
jgi:hypothetical protein